MYVYYSICRANSSSFFPRRHRHHARERRFWVAFLNKRWRDLSYSMISVGCKWSLMIKKMAPFFSFDKFQKMVGMNKFKCKVLFIKFHFENFSPDSLKIFRNEKIKLIKYQLIDMIWRTFFVSINIFKNHNYHDIIGILWWWSRPPEFCLSNSLCYFLTAPKFTVQWFKEPQRGISK